MANGDLIPTTTTTTLPTTTTRRDLLENRAMLQEGSPSRDTAAGSPGRLQAQSRMAAPPAYDDMISFPDEWQGSGGAGRGGRGGPRHRKKSSRGGGSGGYEEVNSGSDNNGAGAGAGGRESGADGAESWSLTPGSHRQQAPVAAAPRRQPPPRRRGGGAAGGARGRGVLGHVVDVPRREKVFPVSVSGSEGSFDRWGARRYRSEGRGGAGRNGLLV